MPTVKDLISFETKVKLQKFFLEHYKVDDGFESENAVDSKILLLQLLPSQTPLLHLLVNVRDLLLSIATSRPSESSLNATTEALCSIPELEEEADQAVAQKKLEELKALELSLMEDFSSGKREVDKIFFNYIVQVPLQFEGKEKALETIARITSRFPSLQNPEQRAIQFIFGFNLSSAKPASLHEEMAEFCAGFEGDKISVVGFPWQPQADGIAGVNYPFIRNSLMDHAQPLITEAMADPKRQQFVKIVFFDPDTLIHENIFKRAEYYWKQSSSHFTAAHYEFKIPGYEPGVTQGTIPELVATVTSRVDPLVKRAIAEKQFLTYERYRRM